MQKTDIFTKHAAKRSQQRAIPPFIANLILDYGRVTRRHGADCYYLDKVARKELRRELGKKIYARIQDQLNIYVVENKGVLTVAHRVKRIKRHH